MCTIANKIDNIYIIFSGWRRIKLKILIFVCFLITFIPSDSMAAEPIWEEWSTQDNGKWYLLKDSIEFDDNISSAWFMVDFSNLQNVDGKDLRSIRVKYQFNCKELTRKIIGLKVYSKEMGTGQIVDSLDNVEDKEFITYSPMEWEENRYQTLCKKQWEIWK